MGQESGKGDSRREMVVNAVRKYRADFLEATAGQGTT